MNVRCFLRGKKRLLAMVITMALTSACDFKIKSISETDLSVHSLSSKFFFSSIDQTSGHNIAGCIAIDPLDGSRYVATMLGGVLTIGANTYTASGGYDLVVTKQNRSGAFLWSKFITGNGMEQVVAGANKCMAIADGKVFLSFITTSATLTIDAFSEALVGTNDSYVVGFNESDGALAYHRHFGTPAGYSLVIGVASRGNTVYWSGWSTDMTIPGPVATCSTMCANYGAINAQTGVTLWDRRWGGGMSAAYGLTAGNQNDLYLVGLYQNTANDPGIGTPLDVVGLASGFIERVSSVDGTPIWIRKFDGTTGQTQSTTVQIDANDSAYVSVVTTDPTVDLQGNGIHTLVASSGPLVSYDLNGNFRWVTDLPHTSSASQIEYDSRTNRILASTMGSAPPIEPFLYQLSTDGILLDSLVADASAGTAYGLGIALDPANSSFVVLAGIQDTVIVNGQTYTSIVPGAIQTVFFERK
jgi:hypothetical protein